MSVLCFKLANGEEIIARCPEFHISTNENDLILTRMNKGNLTIKIETPRLIGLQDGEKGVTLGMMPWTLGNPSADTELLLAGIYAAYSPTPQVEKAYMSQTSKIQLL